MSSPSGSSTSSWQSQHQRAHHHASGSGSASTSGRTTPEPHNLHHLQHTHSGHGQASQNVNSKVLPQTIYGSSPNSNPYLPQQPARRSSTPSQAFLKPLFFSGFHQQHQHQHQQPHTHSSPAPSDGRADPPRRTSFGSALGSRLGALSALGVTSGWGSPTPTSQTPASPIPDSSSASSAATSPNLQPIDSMRNSQSADSVPLAKPKVRKEVERRHICVPDGCGGFVTVEQK